MRLPRLIRIVALVLFAAIAFAFFLASSGLSQSLARDSGTTSQEDETPSIDSLTESIAGLEARIAELELHQETQAAQELDVHVFDAIAAVYLLDRIDIHALHDRLHDGDGIMPADAGQIRPLVPLISTVLWPEELNEEATALAQTLTQLAAALADDDLESALPLASAAHEAQHHFSASVSDWYVSIQMPVEEPEHDGHTDDDDDHGHTDDDDDHGHTDDDDHGHSDDDDDHGHTDDDDDHGHTDDDDDHGHAEDDDHGHTDDDRDS